jgi:hypothetical protein
MFADKGRGLLLALATMGSVCVVADESSREPMRVIGAGFGRTSTLSLYTALNSIGYKTHHMKEVIDHSQTQWWADYFDGGQASELLDKVEMAGYNATTDFPGCLLYPQFLERNPTSKVILSVRDSPEAWAKSVTETIGKMGGLMRKRPFVWMVPGFGSINSALFTNISFDDKGAMNRESAAAAYSAWLVQVKAAVPASQLLVHNAKQGWPPLCEFLGLEGSACPSNRGEQYPRVNDTAEMTRMIRVLTMVGEYFDITIGCLVGVVVSWLFFSSKLKRHEAQLKQKTK